MASATAVTAVGAVVGVASGSEATSPQATEVAGATLLADVPSAAQAQTVSDNFVTQSTAQQAAADAAAQKAAEEAARLKAAADAQAKAAADKAAADAAKAAADKAAADAAAAARAKATSAMSATADSASAPPASSFSAGSVQAIAAGMMDGTQFQCFSNIVTRESGWNYTARNPSGAYGLVQALPGSKMASAGADWQTNPATQIKWGLGYMNDRYGSPCGAWSFWQAHSWY
ncbi:ATPase subunit of ABC transporter with duplicated ATPase domains [Kitasatospora sp. MAP12-15]|nr:ATPase subunit of ABC transporter with duplicated ATPase domains [Kitasatospora sp. MAP12-44]